MSFWSFWWTAVKNATHNAWHLGHKVHLGIVFIAGGCVWLGINFDEQVWIQLPMLVLVVACVFEVFLQGHYLYLEQKK